MAKNAYRQADDVPQSAPACPGTSNVVSIRDLKAVCTTCSMRELCLPFGLDVEELAAIDTLVGSRRRVKKEDDLYQAGDAFDGLYAVRVGSMKSTVLGDDGRGQVIGYHMPGDIVGLDGMATDRHVSRATALEDTEVCVLPFDRLDMLAQRVPALSQNLRRLLAREITRDRSFMLLLGTTRAEERVAAFLLDLAARHRLRGYSSTRFLLRMTREEIGSHLGLKLETVSRLFSRFADEGLILVNGRVIRLLDRLALSQIVSAS